MAGVVAVLGMILTGVSGARRATPKETVILAGGCFWGVEAVFEHVRGVTSVVSGYATPAAPPSAEPSMRGGKGYAEAVRVKYDPSEVSYRQLLEIFFTVAHDPTQLDRQGPDIGPEYRSAIFVQNEEQRQGALDYLEGLRAGASFPAPVVTEIAQLKSFRQAEELHQDYVRRHPKDQYVVVNDVPKLAELRRRFPALYRD